MFVIMQLRQLVHNVILSISLSFVLKELTEPRGRYRELIISIQNTLFRKLNVTAERSPEVIDVASYGTLGHVPPRLPTIYFFQLTLELYEV